MSQYIPNFGGEARSMVGSAVSQAKGSLTRRPAFRTMILYILMVFLVFLGVGFMGHLLIAGSGPLSSVDNGTFWNYAIIMFVVMLLGLWNMSAMRSFMKWIAPQDYLQAMLMTLLIGIIGCVTMYLLSFSPRWIKSLAEWDLKNNVRPLLSTVLVFPLPFLVNWAYENFDLIPPKIYKLWQYNPLLQMPQLTEGEFKQTMFVIFSLDIRYKEKNSYDLRSKIPNRMMVGDGFQFSMDEHNQNEPGRVIEMRDEQGQYYRWYFFIKKPWWKADLFVDPDKTSPENYLKDGNRIIARRLPVSQL